MSGLGAVVINSDEFFERGLKKAGLPLDLDKIDAKQRDAIRKTAKQLVNSKLKNVLNGLLPIVIDGTGRDFKKIKNQAEALMGLGYDVSMVFVNTSLEVAKARNLKRERKVPEEIVVKAWKDVQGNLGNFQKLFGSSNFKLVDNSKILKGDDLSKLQTDLFKVGKKFIESPLKNRVGIKLIKALKKMGGKMISDLGDEPKVSV